MSIYFYALLRYFFFFYTDIESMDADSIWNNVKPLIKEQNTTQEAIAKKCDIPFRTFQGWISKSIIPDAVSLYKIAQSLNVSVEYLITGRHPNNAETVDRTKTLLAEAMRTLDDIK
ncbi:XRE family transcriptional regulator [Treponema phagedenis]|uniref:DNA-binding helix-turn-helix protein n=2 Tax=Treponema phagedenis TaxID=162 RepID=A0A0B7GUX6_TREPH|nr:helix-turn-helix transcriptional regulator [Treponema phagedenis]QEK01218.1 helix-turn-helix transcriptional regulator [Treponema phagedenis]QSH93585.1 XRE family transcriptional regulator [Treponema phagedenis]QSH99896.1 XRE family transcriptional regulator [Treponema phagedenis]CEM60471.1 DNA-binding helix-turn-helix protein [Treponema phagedenis]